MGEVIHVRTPAGCPRDMKRTAFDMAMYFATAEIDRAARDVVIYHHGDPERFAVVVWWTKARAITAVVQGSAAGEVARG